MNEWLYWDKCSPEDYEGFVYKITNLNTKEIRVYLKKYKVLYLETLRKIHNQ